MHGTGDLKPERRRHAREKVRLCGRRDWFVMEAATRQKSFGGSSLEAVGGATADVAQAPRMNMFMYANEERWGQRSQGRG